MYKLVRYNLYLQQQRNVMFVQCMLSFPYENNEFKKFKFFFCQCCAYKRLLVCLFVRVKHGRDYHSMYLSRGSMFNFLLEQIAQLLSFNLFFFFEQIKLNLFLARTIVNLRCVSVTKKRKGKEWIVNKILQGFLVFNCSFYEICI